MPDKIKLSDDRVVFMLVWGAADVRYRIVGLYSSDKYSAGAYRNAIKIESIVLNIFKSMYEKRGDAWPCKCDLACWGMSHFCDRYGAIDTDYFKNSNSIACLAVLDNSSEATIPSLRVELLGSDNNIDKFKKIWPEASIAVYEYMATIMKTLQDYENSHGVHDEEPDDSESCKDIGESLVSLISQIVKNEIAKQLGQIKSEGKGDDSE